jgi:hypothetical protein
MTPTIKRGETLRLLLDQFTDDEWAALYPWDSATAGARQADRVHPVTAIPDPATRTILLTADTSGWLPRIAQIDLRITRDGRITHVPPSEFFSVLITNPATEAP